MQENFEEIQSSIISVSGTTVLSIMPKMSKEPRSVRETTLIIKWEEWK